jgi:hypothetical protein
VDGADVCPAPILHTPVPGVRTLVYRVRLQCRQATLLQVSVRRGKMSFSLIGGETPAAFQVTVRYAAPDGRVLTHRGQIHAVVPLDATLVVAGWQVDETEALIALRPARHGRHTGRGLAVADQFWLPVGLWAWGVTAIRGVETHLSLRAFRGAPAGGESRTGAGSTWLTVAGVLRLLLHTGGTVLRLWVPFVRMVTAEVEGGLHWQALGGVTGLRLSVGEGGQISGEVTLTLRVLGRAEPNGASPPADAPIRPSVVREVAGRIAAVQAAYAGPGAAVVNGEAELDLYWADQAGRSRWTGRTGSFSALLELPGLAEADLLEAQARLAQLSWTGQGPSGMHGLVAVSVTALRPAELEMGAVRYRLERVLGTATATLPLEVPPDGAPPATARGTMVQMVHLPLAGTAAAGWARLALTLGTPGVRGRHWRVAAGCTGTVPGGEEAPGLRQGNVVGRIPAGTQGDVLPVATLQRVDRDGLWLRAHLYWDAAGLPPAAPATAAADMVSGLLDLPGPVRRVWHVEVAGGPGPDCRVRALVLAEGRGWVLVSGRLHWLDGPAAGQGAALPELCGLSAFPVLRDGTWHLQVMMALRSTRTSSPAENALHR